MYRHERYRATLRSPIEFNGVGIHSGKPVRMRVCPLYSDGGIVFKRTDVKQGEQLIELSPESVVDPVLCTRVVNGDGVSVAVVEHLLAAFRICRITDAMVEIDGEEVPGMDGSAAVFVNKFNDTGLKYRNSKVPVIAVARPIVVRSGNGELSISPSKKFSVSVELQYERVRAVVGKHNSHSFSFDDDLSNIAAARTFGWLDDYHQIRARGFALGSSEENTIVIFEDGAIMNAGGLRHEKEIVMHKCLDLIGDLSVLGCDILGSIKAVNPSHALNNLLITEITKNFRAPENEEVTSPSAVCSYL
ncbi:MAG: UDP-3-O-acyl-N-acetylglucosamine deacetylase [Holosporales bacterium]|nr:UDP-3-O-acyl-N-acetylglucosamine deacetylase [Holosporales bacterium]